MVHLWSSQKLDLQEVSHPYKQEQIISSTEGINCHQPQGITILAVKLLILNRFQDEMNLWKYIKMDYQYQLT